MKNSVKLGFIVSVLIFSNGCNKEIKANNYTSMPVLKGNFKNAVSAKGKIKPMIEEPITVANDLWGNVEKMVPEGTIVKKGDFVALINAREMVEYYNNSLDDYATTKVETEKQKANLPVEMLKLDSELTQKQNNYETKSFDYKILKKGPKEDIKTKIDTDIDISKLKISNSNLIKKRELYKRGYLSQQEINTSEIDYQTVDSDLKKSEIEKLKLSPDYKKAEFNKAKLTEEQAKLDLEVNNIENKARKSSLKLKSNNGDFRIQQYQSRMTRFEKSIKLANMTSPIDGIVIYPKIWGWRKPHVGMEVWNGFTFLSVAQIDKLKIETRINEQEIINVKQGQQVEITINSLPGKVFSGKVLRISKLAKYLDERNPSGLKYFDVDISISNKLTQLKPNMNIDLKIISSDYKDSYYIPVEALIEEGKNTYVYFNENDQPVKKQVKVKERNQDYVLLADKLSGKEQFYLISENKEKI